MKKLMMVMSAALLALGASAATEVVDGVMWYYETFSDGGKICARIISGNEKYAGDLTIPPLIGGCPVSQIRSSAFYNCVGLKSLVIPFGVKSIGYDALRGCSELTSVTIPDGVESIGSSAFNGCSRLTSVVIPGSVTSIGSSAFNECGRLMEFVLGEDNQFYCAKNRLLCSKDGTKVIAGVNGAVEIPEGVQTISSYAFSSCSGLVSVRIPSSVVIIGNRAFSGCGGLVSVSIPASVTSIGDEAFYFCRGLTTVLLQSGLTSIGEKAFSECNILTSITIPPTVMSIGLYAFYNCSGLRSVEFLGAPPNGVTRSELLSSYGVKSYPREYGAEWQKSVEVAKFKGYDQPNKPAVEIVSATIRAEDSTIMDVVYKVRSAKPKVKVRALAFQDGERSFAKAVRPTEFIEDTAKNIGDAVTANEEHKLSWRVSANWKVDLAKVKFEVLAVEEDLLPLELTTIPKTVNYPAMEISWNAMTKEQVFDALLWLYADGDVGLTLTDGDLKNGAISLAFNCGLGRGREEWSYGYVRYSDADYQSQAIRYVYSKMGFSVLSGDELKYANEMTRLGLSPSGVRQYAWRTVEE